MSNFIGDCEIHFMEVVATEDVRSMVSRRKKKYKRELIDK